MRSGDSGLRASPVNPPRQLAAGFPVQNLDVISAGFVSRDINGPLIALVRQIERYSISILLVADFSEALQRSAPNLLAFGEVVGGDGAAGSGGGEVREIKCV